MAKILRKIYRFFRGPGACCALVVAAGSSSRMGGVDKIYAELCGKPVLAHTLLALQNSDMIDSIVLVVKADSVDRASKLCTEHGISKLVAVKAGGDSRLDSVSNGLAAVPDRTELVAIHDGARPLVTEAVIAAAIRGAIDYHAAAAAVPATSTIKVVKDEFVVSTPDRSTLREVQTPQVFKAGVIKAAIKNARKKQLAVTDDCSAVEALGAAVRLTEGSYENIKITTSSDLVVAEALLKGREA